MMTAEELGKIWKRVPGNLIWKNVNTGEFIAIHGSEDEAYYVVKKTAAIPDTTWVTGSVLTKDVSPYFVLRSKPVGEYGRTQNAMVKSYEKWKYGTLDDAIAYAMGVMSRSFRKTNWKRWY